MEYKDVSVLDFGEPVSVAIAKILRGDKCVVITKDGEYYGIFGELDVNEVIDTSKEKVGSVCRKAPLLKEMEDVRDVLRDFLNGRFKALPIKTKDGFKIIDRNSFLKHLLEQNLLPNAKVAEVMSTPVLGLEQDGSIAKALEIMRKNNIRRVIVTDKGRLIGILAMKDILPVFETPKNRLPFVKEKSGLGEIPIRNYMNTSVLTLPPESSISLAVSELQKKDVPSVIICEGDRPLGLLSVRDLLEFSVLKEERDNIYLSGMDRADEEYLDEVKSTIKNTVDKIKNMIRVDYVAVHYKKQRYKGLRSRYEIKVRVKSDNIITVDNADWDIRSATQGAMKELFTTVKKIVDKEKTIAESRQRNRRRN